MENSKELKTAQEFYNFFEAIDEQFWTQNVLRKRRKLKDTGWFDCGCALYHLGTRDLRTNKGLISPSDFTGYGYLDELSKDNVFRLGQLLKDSEYVYFGDSDAQTTILHENDTLVNANSILGSPKNYNLLDIKPAQQAKLAKANILNALKQIIEND